MKRMLKSSTIARVRYLRDQCAHILSHNTLSKEEAEIRKKCEESFHFFVVNAWQAVDTDPFSDNWHIKAICDHLQALYEGRIYDLIINLPPRTGKTTICYVLFVAWVWIRDPSLSFLCTSYARDLSLENSDKCRQFISCDWFKRLWGHQVRFGTSKRRNLLSNAHGGFRRATSLGGSNMGFGGHFILMDDPNNITNMYSHRLRKDANEKVAYIGTSRTRKTRPRRLVTQQRIDADDATGNLLKNNNIQGWVHLFIPELFEPDRVCTTVSLRGGEEPWKDPRKKDGEMLDPSWRGREFLDRVQSGMSKYSVQAQYQQNPLLPEGNLIDPEWFRAWKKPYHPHFDYILQSWDTALTVEEESAFSVCTTWGCFEDRNLNNHVMLLDVFSGKLRFPELRNKAVSLDRKFGPDEILIESKVSGYSLKQELEAFGLPVTGFNPNKYGNKEKRCIAVSGFIEAGFVWIQYEEDAFVHPTDFSEKLLHAAKYFPQTAPGTDTADIIDSMSQALAKLSERALLANRDRIRNKDKEKEWREEDDEHSDEEPVFHF